MSFLTFVMAILSHREAKARREIDALLKKVEAEQESVRAREEELETSMGQYLRLIIDAQVRGARPHDIFYP